MRYWAYFAAKLIVVAGILFGSLALLNPLAPHDSDSSAIEPDRSASTPPAAPGPKSYPKAPRVTLEDASAAAARAKADNPAEPNIQVEIVPPSGKDIKDGDVAKPSDNDDKLRVLAPLSHAGEYLAINLAFMVWFLFGAGMLYLIVYDQRYRCRVCLRRLRMPVETGSRGFMLQMGRPRTEYICPYGHGTLKQEEFQTSGLENPEWTAHSGDMWDELYAASKHARDDE
ncbi:MAG: hypothetical protein ABSG03_11445 [Bryobacteraceae bacterium]|jgi:hypothetical protein